MGVYAGDRAQEARHSDHLRAGSGLAGWQKTLTKCPHEVFFFPIFIEFYIENFVNMAICFFCFNFYFYFFLLIFFFVNFICDRVPIACRSHTDVVVMAQAGGVHAGLLYRKTDLCTHRCRLPTPRAMHAWP